MALLLARGACISLHYMTHVVPIDPDHLIHHTHIYTHKGPRPASSRFPQLNHAQVVPPDFAGEWEAVMDMWGAKMLQAVTGVAALAAEGFGLPADAFTKRMQVCVCEGCICLYYISMPAFCGIDDHHHDPPITAHLTATTNYETPSKPNPSTRMARTSSPPPGPTSSGTGRKGRFWRASITT